MPTRTAAQAALTNLRDVLPKLRQIRTELTDTINQAGVDARADQTLTSEGQRQRIHNAREQAQQRAQAATAAVLTEVESDAETVRLWVATARPQPATGVEAIAARQNHWRRAETLMAAGMTPHEVIGRYNNLEALHALREELPTWQLAAAASDRPGGMFNGTYDLPTGDVLVRLVDERMAALVDPVSAEAIRADREVSSLTAQIKPMADLTQAESLGINGGATGLSAAIASKMAGQSA